MVAAQGSSYATLPIHIGQCGLDIGIGALESHLRNL